MSASVSSTISTTKTTIDAAILGASGYTGAELLRLLAHHPQVKVRALTADRHAGRSVADVFPHLAAMDLPRLAAIGDVDWRGIDVCFCCLPHATTQEVLRAVPGHVRIVDLSADFRLRDPAEYEQWYGHAHRALELQAEAVYGLTEIRRAAISNARLVAVPGCYPTTALLPLVPLVEARCVIEDDISIDAKSGVSGAGRALKETSLFCEVAEGLGAYALDGHRHVPEIEQALAEAAGRPVAVNFVPHLVPMNRGMLATIHVRLAPGATAEDLRATLARRYAGEPFVRLAAPGVAPASRHVRGSNLCLIGVFPGRIAGRAVVVSAIDNLVKGASGQALQDMNAMFGLPETLGLSQTPMFP